jgi:hypothetical protein
MPAIGDVPNLDFPDVERAALSNGIEIVYARSTTVPVTRVAVEFTIIESDDSIMCNAQVETYGKTGVEMEALTAVQVGLLTIYDMCKAVDRGMTITDVKLLEKHGSRWELMHLKDLKKGVPTGFHNGGTDPNNDVALGTGQMDWANILKAAQKSGVKHYFIEDESASSVEQIPQSLKYLESVSW